MPGLTIDLPEPTVAPAGAKEVTLPSGAKATIRQGTGRDLRMAQMAMGTPFDALKFEYALIAQVAMLDGKKLSMESIDAMRLDDVLELQAEVNKVIYPTRAPAEGAAS